MPSARSGCTAVIRAAVWPDDADAATTLLRGYAAWLADRDKPILIPGLDAELLSLHYLFSEPRGVLLLASQDAGPAGCVAVRVRRDWPGSCELKRLWVEPHAQGQGLGRCLAEAAIRWARQRQADTVLLDTVAAAMPRAASLYRSLGFQVTQRHNANPVAGVEFMKLYLNPTDPA